MSVAVSERKTHSREQLLAAREKFVAKQQGLERQILDLAEREAEAVKSALAEAPAKSPYVLNGAPDRLRKKREALEAQLAKLAGDEKVEGVLRALERQIEEASRDEEIADLRSRTEQARKLQEAEDAAWRRVGEIYAELVQEWNVLSDVLEESAQLRGEVLVRGERFLETVRFIDPETAEAWQEVGDYPNGPRAPVDFGGLLQMLTDLIVDAFNDGYRFADQPGGSKHYSARLAKLLPDLRGVARRIAVSDATPVAAFSRSPEPGKNFATAEWVSADQLNRSKGLGRERHGPRHAPARPPHAA